MTERRERDDGHDFSLSIPFVLLICGIVSAVLPRRSADKEPETSANFFNGDVRITDSKGQVIPKDKITNNDIRDSVVHRLEEVKAKIDALFKSPQIENLGKDAVIFAEKFHEKLQEAITQAKVRQYGKVCKALREIAENPPKVNINPGVFEGAVDTKELGKLVQGITKPLLDAYHVAEWMEYSEGKALERGAAASNPASVR